MENQTKDKQENINPVAAPVQQAPAANPDAELMTSLLNFIKHPAVTGIAGYLLGKHFESKKQDEEQEKITEKLQRQIESLKEHINQLSEERKPIGTNEQERFRLPENKYKNKGVIQLD